jgi:4-amino-4-deoxy-L-arabinose transferase-like glycosyltransferase
MSRDDATGRPAFRRAAAIVLAGAALMFGLRLGAPDFDNHDVARYSQMAFEMRHAGTLVPTLRGTPYHEAMPLPTWACLAAADLQGEVTPISGRILPALSALATVALVLFAGARLVSPGVGVLAAGLTALASLTFTYARCSRVDETLGLAVTAAVIALFAGARTESRGRAAAWCAGAGAALALAVAAKGPLAAGLVAAAAGPALLIEGRFRFLAAGGLLVLAVASVLTAAWFLPYASCLGPEGLRDFYSQFIHGENLAKFEGNLGKVEPFYMYAVQMVPKLAPVSVLAILGAVRLLRRPGATTPFERLALSWFLVPLLVLSFSKGKQMRYLIPLVPAMAFLGAMEVQRLIEAPGEGPRRALARVLRGFGGLFVLVGVAAPFALARYAESSVLGVGLAAVVAAGGAAAVLAPGRGRPGASLLGLFVAAAAAVTAFYAAYLPSPGVQRRESPLRECAAEISPFLGDRGTLPVVTTGASTRPGAEPQRDRDFACLGLYLGRWVAETPADRVPPGDPVLAPAPLDGRPVLRTLDIRWDGGGDPDRWLLLGPRDGTSGGDKPK